AGQVADNAYPCVGTPAARPQGTVGARLREIHWRGKSIFSRRGVIRRALSGGGTVSARPTAVWQRPSVMKFYKRVHSPFLKYSFFRRRPPQPWISKGWPMVSHPASGAPRLPGGTVPPGLRCRGGLRLPGL